MRPFKTTIDCKTREFQYKILNRLLRTNKILNKMNLEVSPLCSFCGAEEESLEHFICQCAYVYRFWFSISNWLSSVIGYNVMVF